MIVTKQELFKARTDKGGFTGKQVRIGQGIAGKSNWLKTIIGMNVSDDIWIEFVQAREKTRKKKTEHKKKIINPVSRKRDDWSWKPDKADIPEPKFKKTGKLSKNRQRNKNRKKKVCYDHNFYNSREWKALRVRALERYECRCMMCGRSPKEHGVVIHVDHIKPRSKYPELSLEFSNLQLLCDDCNFGKGNKYETDYRPDILSDEDREILLGAIINQ